MNSQTTYADRIFQDKHIHLLNAEAVMAHDTVDYTQMISEQRQESQAIAIEIAKLCAKASSLSLGNRSGRLPGKSP